MLDKFGAVNSTAGSTIDNPAGNSLIVGKGGSSGISGNAGNVDGAKEGMSGSCCVCVTSISIAFLEASSSLRHLASASYVDAS